MALRANGIPSIQVVSRSPHLCPDRSRARAAYGVVADATVAQPRVDTEASDLLRAERRAERSEREPFFDRGPGYRTLSGGADAAPCDWLEEEAASSSQRAAEPST